MYFQFRLRQLTINWFRDISAAVWEIFHVSPAVQTRTGQLITYSIDMNVCALVLCVITLSWTDVRHAPHIIHAAIGSSCPDTESKIHEFQEIPLKIQSVLLRLWYVTVRQKDTRRDPTHCPPPLDVILKKGAKSTKSVSSFIQKSDVVACRRRHRGWGFVLWLVFEIKIFFLH